MNLNVPIPVRIHSIASSVFAPLLMALVGLPLLVLQYPPSVTPSGQAVILLIALAAVGSGCAALSWVRPRRAGLSPPHVMLSLGFAGMLIGLMYDLVNAGPARLDTLCAQSAALGFVDALALHLSFLPGMHVGMLAGGLLAIPLLRRVKPKCKRYLCSLFAQNLMCTGWMLAGMTVGALWLSRWPFPAAGNTLPGMLGGMFAGMTWGMVFSVALYRSFLNWRDRTRT